MALSDAVLLKCKALNLQPGSYVVYETPAVLSGEQRARAARLLRELFPDNKSIIVDGGGKLTVLHIPQKGDALG